MRRNKEWSTTTNLVVSRRRRPLPKRVRAETVPRAGGSRHIYIYVVEKNAKYRTEADATRAGSSTNGLRV